MHSSENPDISELITGDLIVGDLIVVDFTYSENPTLKFKPKYLLPITSSNNQTSFLLEKYVVMQSLKINYPITDDDIKKKFEENKVLEIHSIAGTFVRIESNLITIKPLRLPEELNVKQIKFYTHSISKLSKNTQYK